MFGFFFYFKKDSAYTGHVESGSTSDIMGYICRFLFFYWKVEKIQIKKKHMMFYMKTL